MQKNIDPMSFPIEPPVSICPAGECFPLPNKDDEDADFTRLQKLVTEQRQLGREIVVVMGVGFVGAVMIFPGPGIGGYCLPKDGGRGYGARPVCQALVGV